MPNSPGKTPEAAGFFPSFSRGAMRLVPTLLYTAWKTLLLYLVALNAVAIGGKGSPPHPMAKGAGGYFRLGHPVQGLAVVERRTGLRKDLGMADGAIALDPLIVQLMSERDRAVLIVEN